jgi:hypothetical protein
MGAFKPVVSLLVKDNSGDRELTRKALAYQGMAKSVK